MNSVKDEPKKDFLSIWVNLLIVDSFNRVPEIVHFKSSKIFKMTLEKNKNSKDLLKKIELYTNSEEYFVLL
jgi:hypothetical protein